MHPCILAQQDTECDVFVMTRCGDDESCCVLMYVLVLCVRIMYNIWQRVLLYLGTNTLPTNSNELNQVPV